MTQVDQFNNIGSLNDWLEEHQNDYIIKDIKFGYCGTNTCTHERYLVIYETMPTMPEGIPFSWTDKLKGAYDSVNGGLQIGGV